MPFIRLLQIIILGLISLFGILVLIGLAKWFHYWLYVPHGLDEGMSPDDWRLGLGILSFVVQVSAAIEALLIAFITRFRWINLSRGRLAVGVFSLVFWVCAIPEIQRAIASAYINIWWFLLYELVLMLPVTLAWGLLYFWRTQRLASK